MGQQLTIRIKPSLLDIADELAKAEQKNRHEYLGRLILDCAPADLQVTTRETKVMRAVDMSPVACRKFEQLCNSAGLPKATVAEYLILNEDATSTPSAKWVVGERQAITDQKLKKFTTRVRPSVDAYWNHLASERGTTKHFVMEDAIMRAPLDLEIELDKRIFASMYFSDDAYAKLCDTAQQLGIGRAQVVESLIEQELGK